MVCQTNRFDSRELTSAGLDALGPCVLKLRVAGVAALLEPSTAAEAATHFANFVSAALGTIRVGGCRYVRRRDCS